MNQVSCNCIVCADELHINDLESISISNNYKICKACLDKSDPADDYRQARQIVAAYFLDPTKYFNEAQKILNSLKR